MEELKEKEVVVKHIFRVGNKLADFLTNNVFNFAGTNSIEFTSVKNLPGQAQALGIQTLRTKKCRNANFNIYKKIFYKEK